MQFATKSIVFFRLLIPLLLGILLSFWFSIKLPLFTFPIVVLASGVLISLLLLIRLNFRYRFVYGLVVSMSLFAIGLSRMATRQLSNEPPKFEQIGKQGYVVKIVSEPTLRAKSIRYLAEVHYHPVQELVGQSLLLYLSKESKQVFNNGDELYLKQYINRIAAPRNPHEFNYQQFMNRKGVFYQSFLKDEHILHREESRETSSFLAQLQNYCLQFIEEDVWHEQQSVAKALLIGYKNDLDRQTNLDFQAAGTMHVLAVSGLHVGIIYLLLLTLFDWLQGTFSYPKWVNLLLILVGIWCFALLTGGKASVLRAAAMFSLFAIGKEFFPTTNSFNILSAVAFSLLLLNPYYLLDVGFQLSFSAVLGILLIVPLFKPLYTKYKFLNFFIGITILSIAAQLATLPITLLVFHQYPTYALFSNLFAIPLTTAIVAVGFIGIICFKLPLVGVFIGKVLSFLILLLQRTNSFFADLDYSVLGEIYFTKFQAALLGVSLLLLIVHFRTQKTKLLYSALFGLLTFFLFTSIHKIQASQQSKAFVYATNGNLIIDHIDARKSNLYSLSPIKESLYGYSIKGNHLANAVRDTIHQELAELMVINDVSIQLVNKQTKSFSENAMVYIITEPTNHLLKQSFLQDKKVLIYNRRRPTYFTTPANFHFLSEDGALELN